MPANRTWRDRRAAAGLLLGRLLLAFIFIHEGWTIIGNYGVAAAYMQRFGVPAILLPAVIALELGGGLLIAAGAFTRILAPAFAIFCMLTAVLFHAQLVDANQLLHLQKDLAIAGGFLVLAVSGPGSLSADRCLGLSSGGVDGGATQEGARRVEYPLGDLLCLGVGADRRPIDDHDLLVLGGPLDEAERDAASGPLT